MGVSGLNKSFYANTDKLTQMKDKNKQTGGYQNKQQRKKTQCSNNIEGEKKESFDLPFIKPKVVGSNLSQSVRDQATKSNFFFYF